jgi:hypothetical protein
MPSAALALIVVTVALEIAVVLLVVAVDLEMLLQPLSSEQKKVTTRVGVLPVIVVLVVYWTVAGQRRPVVPILKLKITVSYPQNLVDLGTC